MRRAAPLALILALALAGCAALGPSDEEACSGGAAPGCDGVPAPQLEVTLWPEGEDRGAPVSATLACRLSAGDVADAEAACALLAAEGVEALAPVPADAICTELYGGPQEAIITGSLDGAQVTARLSRVNGCEIDRWERLASLLPADQPVPLEG